MELAKILQKRNHLIIHSGWGKTWPSFAQAAGNRISKQPVQSGALTSKAGQNWTQVTELRHGRRTVTGGLQGRPVRSPRGLGDHTRQPPWTGTRTDRPNLVTETLTHRKPNYVPFVQEPNLLAIEDEFEFEDDF
jgi:hypothetical protein